MSDHARPGERHPLCTCPEVTFSGPPPDRSACAGGTLAHPVIGPDELRELTERRKA